MAQFQYTVTDSTKVTSVEDAAVDAAAARREALMLLSGLLRDLAISGGEGSGFVVEVHDAHGALVTRLTAGLTQH
ncbi:MAG: DUF6894 family protein [Brevundimonas sp.]|uniref:DUF6894 family protein n=1 Tax=Brevundimonas sp. TaxID=1871086 RepID=UPI003919433E